MSGSRTTATEGEEDRLRNLLSSIGQLSEHGEIPAYAFATLMSTAPPQAIAEHLHQRWLSDPHFAKIAPQIISHMGSNVNVYSKVLALALRDYNSRNELRVQSRGMFRNYVRTLIELYPVYRQIDKSLSACLVDPLFRCLQMLSEEKPDDRDLHCFAHLFAEFGQKLYQLNPSECDRLVLACRRWVCSNRIPLEEETRRLLMNAIDLWTYSWDRQLFPDCLRRHYEHLEEEEAQRRQRQQLESGGRHYSSASTLPRTDQNHCLAPSGSSQHLLISESASSSLPSSATALDVQQPQQSATSGGGGKVRANNVLPNGDLHLAKLNLCRGNRIPRGRDGAATEGEESEGKESTI